MFYYEIYNYQVDIFFDNSKESYKIYKNGGWNDYIILDKTEFEKSFYEID